ncbi:MAG: M24 family metallopeptidase [Solitalea-like symbiont of Tyrophagus putrescentiae]
MNKLEQIRQLMAKDDISAYIIFNTDAHQNEYIPDRYKYIKWLTNFSGSNAVVIVTNDYAHLWTDSRYFEQAEIELKDSGFELMKDYGTASYIKWLSDNLTKRSALGFNGYLANASIIVQILDQCKDLKIKINYEYDPISKLWEDKSNKTKNKVTMLGNNITGQSTAQKISEIRSYMQDINCQYNLISKLDDIAWIYNMRGNDIEYNPVVESFTLIGLKDCVLFIDIDKLSDRDIRILNDYDIIVKDYDSVMAHLMYLFASDRKAKFIFSKAQNCYSIYKFISENFTFKDNLNPSTLLKSIKNEVEIKNIQKAMRKDGIALTRFFMWLQDNAKSGKITECDASDKLTEFFKQDDDFISHSFSTISAYKANAALPHYSPNRQKPVLINNDGLYLLDTGVHYNNGTTDITRVVSLGNPTEQEKKDFTLVLKAMINGLILNFPENTKGYQIDAIVRQCLWNNLIDFGHGTGHGVGYILNVHEGPFVLNPNPINISLLPGNLTSVEPGIYRKGQYGIRIENLALVAKNKQNYFGNFYNFKVLTSFIIQTDLVDKSLLESYHIDWLNNYNLQVIDNLKDDLTEKEIVWLKDKSKAI